MQSFTAQSITSFLCTWWLHPKIFYAHTFQSAILDWVAFHLELAIRNKF